LPKTERKGREMRRKAEKWGKGTKRNKRNKQAAKRNEARTKPNKFDLIALSERQKGGKLGGWGENAGKSRKMGKWESQRDSHGLRCFMAPLF